MLCLWSISFAFILYNVTSRIKGVRLVFFFLHLSLDKSWKAKRHIFPMRLVWSEAGKQACYNLESILLMLSNWTSPTSWWVAPWIPDLVSHLTSLCESQQFINRVSETRVLPALRSQGRLFCDKAGNLTPILHPARHCLLNSALPSLAGSLWGVIIFSWEVLVSQRPLTSLDAAQSCRFPPWPCRKWQTLTKPQVCAESSFWFVSSVLPLCVMYCRW